MTIQQLLSQHPVEDIVRTTMAVYNMDEAKYPKLHANYAKLIETLLKLEAIPTDDVLLGIVYQDDGAVMDTALYRGEALANPIPYSHILENTVDPATLSKETLDAAICTEGWPESYSYVFSPWAEIMGYQVNALNVEDVGAVPFLVDVLYELTFFGLEEGDMKAEQHILEESVAEAQAVGGMSPIDTDKLWDELGLPPKSPAEKAQKRLEMQHQLLRNKQRLYHALRRYGGCAKGHVGEGIVWNFHRKT